MKQYFESQASSNLTCQSFRGQCTVCLRLQSPPATSERPLAALQASLLPRQVVTRLVCVFGLLRPGGSWPSRGAGEPDGGAGERQRSRSRALMFPWAPPRLQTPRPPRRFRNWHRKCRLSREACSFILYNYTTQQNILYFGN